MRPPDREYRSVPAEQAERSRGAGESRGVSRSTPLGPPGEGKLVLERESLGMVAAGLEGRCRQHQGDSRLKRRSCSSSRSGYMPEHLNNVAEACGKLVATVQRADACRGAGEHHITGF